MTRILRRSLAAIALLAALPVAASAQVTTTTAPTTSDRAFSVGMGLIGPSIGFGGIEGYDFAIGGRYERGFRAFPELANGVLGLGLDADFLSASEGGVSSRIIGITPVAHYHFAIQTQPKLDPYVGVGLGIFLFNVDVEGFGSNSETQFEPVLKAGARYWLSPRAAGQAEFNSELAALNIAVMFRF